MSTLPHESLFINAFPAECHTDVAFIYEKLGFIHHEFSQHIWAYNFVYVDKNFGSHAIFSHCFINEDFDLDQFTSKQQLIIHCIFSQHYNGFIREKHLRALDNFDGNIAIAIPFIMAQVGNYVYEIQGIALDILTHHIDLTKEFIKRNSGFWRIQQSRVSAVWGEHYRGVQPVPKQWKTFKDYPIRQKIVRLNRLLIEHD